MREDDLFFGFSHYGGNCPNCNSKNTAYWMREIEVTDGYNDWEEWHSCHDCKHNWTDDSAMAVNTYLLNNGYTQSDLDAMTTRIRKLIQGFIKGGDNEQKTG